MKKIAMSENAVKKGETWGTEVATLEELRRLSRLNDVKEAWNPDSLNDSDLDGMSLAERVAFAVQAGILDESGDEWTTEQAVSFWEALGFNTDDTANDDTVKAFAAGALAMRGPRENEASEEIRLQDLAVVDRDDAGEDEFTIRHFAANL